MGNPTLSRWLPTSIALPLLFQWAGCADLERFSTTGEERYCGTLVSAPNSHEGFLPTEADPHNLRLSMTFDVQKLATTPGRITTDDGDRGLCAATGQPLFDDAALRSISEAFHDPISELNFGDGRLKNILVWADTSCQGSLFGVISLVSNGHIELRLFKARPPAGTDAPQSDRSGFVNFTLRKQHDSCGY